jgi:DNA-binding GntR family transcriptional regulator
MGLDKSSVSRYNVDVECRQSATNRAIHKRGLLNADDEASLAVAVSGITNRFGSLERSTLRSQIVDRVYDAIWRGTLKPGDRLVEAELAGQLQVSRAPVREAIAQLVAEGLLVKNDRQGTFVKSLSPKYIVELYTCRACLEEMAARLVARAGDAESFARLEDCVSHIQEAIDAQDEIGVLQADFAFHRTMFELADHGELMRAWSNLGMLAVALLAGPIPHPPNLVEIHQGIVDALRTLDPVRAGSFVRNTFLGERFLTGYHLSEDKLASEVSPALVAEITLFRTEEDIPR